MPPLRPVRTPTKYVHLMYDEKGIYRQPVLLAQPPTSGSVLVGFIASRKHQVRMSMKPLWNDAHCISTPSIVRVRTGHPCWFATSASAARAALVAAGP